MTGVTNVTLTSPMSHPPLAGIRVTFGKGLCIHPVTGARAFHGGIDLRAYYEPVDSVMDGSVESIGGDARSGLWVRIRHAGGLVSSYAHLSRILVRNGEEVESGRVITVTGDSEMGTGLHLHVSMFGYTDRKPLGHPSDYK